MPTSTSTSPPRAPPCSPTSCPTSTTNPASARARIRRQGARRVEGRERQDAGVGLRHSTTRRVRSDTGANLTFRRRPRRVTQPLDRVRAHLDTHFGPRRARCRQRDLSGRRVDRRVALPADADGRAGWRTTSRWAARAIRWSTRPRCWPIPNSARGPKSFCSCVIRRPSPAWPAAWPSWRHRRRSRVWC